MVLPGDAAETDEFLEKFQMAFDPPPSFLENHVEGQKKIWILGA